MDWLADILKNLSISKTLIAAIFVTSVVMYIGPIHAPNSVPKLQPEFVPYLFAGMILTGCLLLFWGLAAIWNLTKTGMRGAVRVLIDSKLSEPETILLVIMAKDPAHPINLDNINYSSTSITKLEFHDWTKQLEAKGLARINTWDDNCISLTDLGRKRALKILRQTRSGSST